MKLNFIILILICVFFNLCNVRGQNPDSSTKKSNDYLFDTNFIYYLIKKYNIKNDDILNRNELIPIKDRLCFDTIYLAHDTVNFGKISVHISTKSFSAEHYIVTIDSNSNSLERQHHLINGYRQHGISPGLYFPESELAKFEVKINNNVIKVPDSIYYLLGNPNLCNFIANYYEPLQIYYFNDLLYIYLWGGNPFLNFYIARFIFNKNSLTKITLIDIDNVGLILNYWSNYKKFNF